MRLLSFLIFLTTAASYSVAEEWTEFSAVLKPSAIQGVGVFTTHDIPKGTKVFSDIKYRWYKLESIPVELRKYCHFVKEDEVLGPERFDRMEAEWFLNHSNDPNVAEIAADFWVAVKDIKTGEELLMDYNQLNELEHLKEPYYK